jgi:hypothetical protein
VVVRGTSRIDAEVTHFRERFTVRGSLLDDAAKPIPEATLTLSATAEGETGLVRLGAERCEGRGGVPKNRGESIVLTSDEAGRFCVRLDVRHPNEDGAPHAHDARVPSSGKYVAHIAFEGGGLVDGATLDVPVDLARRSLSLHFDPEPRVIALDVERMDLQAVAWLEDEESAPGLRTPGAGLALTLRDEAGRVLSTATTDANGHARFTSIASAALGPPGRGELRVEFAGDTNVGPSAHRADIERRAKVDVIATQPTQAGVPEDGIEIRAYARLRLAATSDAGDRAGAARSGAVEAHAWKDPATRTDVMLGAAPIEDGTANVVMTFSPVALPIRSDGTLPVRLRYVSETPWLEPGEEATVLVAIKAPSPFRHVPLLLAGAGVIVWLVLGRARQSRPRPPPPPSRATPNVAPEPRVEIVRPASPHEGWSGRVVDAHDLFPVAGAEVRIERPHFRGVDLLARTSTDTDGRFELHPDATHAAPRDGDKLVVTAPYHARLARPLPAPAELAVGIVQRKRALLDRMIAWARGRGRPFDATPEPTPGHVRKAADPGSDVARWAESIERAAYGGEIVDAQHEAAIQQLAPPELRREVDDPHAAEGPGRGASPDPAVNQEDGLNSRPPPRS